MPSSADSKKQGFSKIYNHNSLVRYITEERTSDSFIWRLQFLVIVLNWSWVLQVASYCLLSRNSSQCSLNLKSVPLSSDMEIALSYCHAIVLAQRFYSIDISSLSQKNNRVVVDASSPDARNNLRVNIFSRALQPSLKTSLI